MNKTGILCKIGIHRPLKILNSLFTDTVTGKTVRTSKCSCGKEWMTDGGKWFGFKILREQKNIPKDYCKVSYVFNNIPCEN